MAIGLKMDLQLLGPEGQRATLGDLKRFVARAEQGKVTDDEELMIEFNEREEVEGFSLWLLDDI